MYTARFLRAVLQFYPRGSSARAQIKTIKNVLTQQRICIKYIINIYYIFKINRVLTNITVKTNNVRNFEKKIRNIRPARRGYRL